MLMIHVCRIYIDGNYPQNVQKYVSTFLRNFTDEEKSLIKGSADTFAIVGDKPQESALYAANQLTAGCLHVELCHGS